MRRGATDPVCGMKVDKGKAIRMDFGGETFYFCGEHCAHSYEAEHVHPDAAALKDRRAFRDRRAVGTLARCERSTPGDEAAERSCIAQLRGGYHRLVSGQITTDEYDALRKKLETPGSGSTQAEPPAPPAPT